MKKNVEINIDIKIAKDMLTVAGFDTEIMTDDEIFEKVLERIKCYGATTTIIN